MRRRGDVVRLFGRRERHVRRAVFERALRGLFRLDRVHARDRRPRRRDRAEVRVDPARRFVDLEIAGHHEDRVVGPVVRRVERDDVLERRGVELVGAADHAAPVRVHGVRFAVDELVEHAVRLGEDALLVLADHHVALGREVRRVHVERREPVGFGPQQPLEVVRRHDLVVVRDVFGREGVVEAADVFGEPVDRLGRGARRALEHQVLEEVREPRAARRVVLAADAVGDVDRDRGHPAVDDEDGAQAVGEGAVDVLDRRDVDRDGGDGR